LYGANLMTVEEIEAMTADRPMTAEQAAIIMLQCPLRHFVAAQKVGRFWGWTQPVGATL
jgi:hypothetical protein